MVAPLLEVEPNRSRAALAKTVLLKLPQRGSAGINLFVKLGFRIGFGGVTVDRVLLR